MTCHLTNQLQRLLISNLCNLIVLWRICNSSQKGSSDNPFVKKINMIIVWLKYKTHQRAKLCRLQNLFNIFYFKNTSFQIVPICLCVFAYLPHVFKQIGPNTFSASSIRIVIITRLYQLQWKFVKGAAPWRKVSSSLQKTNTDENTNTQRQIKRDKYKETNTKTDPHHRKTKVRKYKVTITDKDNIIIFGFVHFQICLFLQMMINCLNSSNFWRKKAKMFPNSANQTSESELQKQHQIFSSPKYNHAEIS